jgi:hypothetical protein
MSVGSGSTRVADLAFQVFGRTLHPDWFSVRVHRRYAQAGWEADVRIIAGGHLVLWGCGPTRLAEVLVGAGTPLPEIEPLFRASLRQERSTLVQPKSGGTTYQSCFAVERLDPETFAHLSDELAVKPGRGVLIHHAPGGTRMSRPAISRIEVETRARGLSIHAFHTFPDERAIVRTQSLFETQAS